MENFSRIALAMVTFLVVVSLLGIGATPIGEAGAEQITFWMSLESAVRYFFAAAIAAVVARRSFLIPAVSLAAFVWLATTYILYSIGQPAGAAFAEVAAGQLTGLFLLILAVVSGALLGRWFYKRELGAAAAAA
jgi:hypothetical protein